MTPGFAMFIGVPPVLPAFFASRLHRIETPYDAISDDHPGDRVRRHLIAHPDARLTTSDAAEIGCVEQAQVGHMLGRYVKAGLIRSERLFVKVPGRGWAERKLYTLGDR